MYRWYCTMDHSSLFCFLHFWKLRHLLTSIHVCECTFNFLLLTVVWYFIECVDHSPSNGQSGCLMFVPTSPWPLGRLRGGGRKEPWVEKMPRTWTVYPYPLSGPLYHTWLWMPLCFVPIIPVLARDAFPCFTVKKGTTMFHLGIPYCC